MAVNIKIVIIINILSEKRPPTHKAAPKIQPTLAFCKQKQFLGLTNRLELWWRTHAWLWKLNTDILDQGLWNSCMEMWGHLEAVLIRDSVVGVELSWRTPAYMCILPSDDATKSLLCAKQDLIIIPTQIIQILPPIIQIKTVWWYSLCFEAIISTIIVADLVMISNYCF